MNTFTGTINIPLACPKCNGKMLAVRYIESLKILKDRSWQVCRQCNYEIEADEFKKRLLTI